MPRTRVIKTRKPKQTVKSTENLENDTQSKKVMCASLLENMLMEANNTRLEMENFFKSIVDEIETVCFEELAIIDPSEGNKTLAELVSIFVLV